MARWDPEVTGAAVVGWLLLVDIEMGPRVEDLLNTILCVVTFVFPGSYAWMVSLGRAISHCWIYAFDHFCVLSSISSYDVASFGRRTPIEPGMVPFFVS